VFVEFSAGISCTGCVSRIFCRYLLPQGVSEFPKWTVYSALEMDILVENHKQLMNTARFPANIKESLPKGLKARGFYVFF
jgi:hypothetical protein